MPKKINFKNILKPNKKTLYFLTFKMSIYIDTEKRSGSLFN